MLVEEYSRLIEKSKSQEKKITRFRNARGFSSSCLKMISAHWSTNSIVVKFFQARKTVLLRLLFGLCNVHVHLELFAFVFKR